MKLYIEKIINWRMILNFFKLNIVIINNKFFQSVLLLFYFITCSNVNDVNAQNNVYKPGKNNSVSADRVIEFSGIEWIVKSGYRGPGPNNFSDSEESVWIDNKGWLHLKIRKINGIWHCAEVYSTQFTNFGEHRFLIEGDIEHFDKNVVLGLFVYADDNHELDIEFSRWGDPGFREMGSFTIQPYTIKGNIERFQVKSDSLRTTHLFNWQKDYVNFASFKGHYTGLLPSSDYLIHQWNYLGDSNPADSDNLRIHLNLWLFRGNSPVYDNDIEMIITKFTHTYNTGVINEKKQQPDNFKLNQNFPNPFNSGTIISYELPEPAKVDLVIYNSLGEKIRTLVTDTQSADYYTVKWDGYDDRQTQAANGIYFYSLWVDQKITLIKKMILLK